MKNLLFLLLVLLFVSCRKEPAIEPALKLENVYEIKDGASDPVDKRIFKIYEKYGVPVFFNDTIGQVFVMNDVKGNPIYKTEKLDLAWTFYSYEKQVYEFEYMTEFDEKTKALNIIEAYLEDAGPSLKPYSFFVTRSGKKYDQGNLVEEYKNGAFLIRFRTLYMTGNWSADAMENQPASMKRQMILDKIVNYPDDIADFSLVSKSTWYGSLAWAEIDPSLPSGWNANSLYDDWSGAIWYSAEELEQMRIDARKVIGKFGFIKGNSFSKGLETPKNATEELRDYVQEMLKYSPDEFAKLWGNQPLVMKKYTILRNIIENKLNVKL